MNAEQRDQHQSRLEPLLVVVASIGQHMRRRKHLYEQHVDYFHEEDGVQLQEIDQ